MKIIVTDRSGGTTSVACEEGWSLMEGLRGAGLPIDAICGGCCLCATCHVYVHPDWLGKLPEQSADELATLADAFEIRDISRLACQINMVDALDGIQVELARTT